MKQNGILILQKDISLEGYIHVVYQDTYCYHILLVSNFYIPI